MVFLVTSMVYMGRAGLSAAEIGLFVGAIRVCPILLVKLGIHLDRKHDPPLLVLICEFVSGLLTLALAIIWRQGASFFYLFTAVAAIRSVLNFVQLGSRNRILKHLDSITNGSESRSVIWLNKVTHGTSLFSAIFAYFFITSISYDSVIWIDGVTYFVNSAAFLFLLIKMKKTSDERSTSTSTQVSMLDYFKATYPYSILDLLLAVVMMGANMYSLRIARGNDVLMVSFLGSYGLAVWVSGYLYRWRPLRVRIFWAAAGLGTLYFILAQVAMPPILSWVVYLLADICYWLMFHQMSVGIQSLSNAATAGPITLWRNTLMIGVLAAGEFLVGAWASSVTLPDEGLIRFCIALILFVIYFRVSNRINENYRHA